MPRSGGAGASCFLLRALLISYQSGSRPVGAAFPEEGPLPPNAHANVGARNPHLGHSASDFGFSVEFHFLAHVSNHLQIFACDFLCRIKFMRIIRKRSFFMHALSFL